MHNDGDVYRTAYYLNLSCSLRTFIILLTDSVHDTIFDETLNACNPGRRDFRNEEAWHLGKKQKKKKQTTLLLH